MSVQTCHATQANYEHCKYSTNRGWCDTSRYAELFGTPERAARTLANICQFAHGGELCDRCQCYLFGDCDKMLRLKSERSIYDAQLEWLRGDAE